MRLLLGEFTRLPELLLLEGSLVSVEPFIVFASLDSLMLATALGLSFTTLPADVFSEGLLDVDALLLIVLLAFDAVLTGALLFDGVLLPVLFPFDIIRALLAPLPYPPIEPRCP